MPLFQFAKAHKHAHRWLGGYARETWRRRSTIRTNEPRHLLFALCDHYEPLWGHASHERGNDRVQRWLTHYPILAAGLHDADGRAPRHTFFFPGEQYRPEYLAGLAQLTRTGLGEVELHLHHDD